TLLLLCNLCFIRSILIYQYVSRYCIIKLLYKEDYTLGSILLIGLLIPVVYLMQLTKKKKAIKLKQTKRAIFISVVSVVITAMIFIMFNDTTTSFWLYLFSAIVVGIIWSILLSGCYYIYQVLSNNLEK